MRRFAILTLILSSALIWSQTPKRQMRNFHFSEQVPEEDNEIFLAYWTVEPDWHSEAQLRNNSVSDPLVVTPVLRSNGEEFPLPPLTIGPQDTAVVNLHEVVASLKRSLPESFGSMALRFHSAFPRQLYAAIMLHRESRPIAFHVDGAGTITQTLTPNTKEGIWWLPTGTADDFLILTNQSNETASVEIRLTNADGALAFTRTDLLPRQTVRKSLRSMLDQHRMSGTYGGLQIRPLTHSESVDSLAFAIDEQIGFGAALKMFDRDPDAAIDERDFDASSRFTLRAPMLALTNADSSLNLPAGTELRPQLMIRNVADHAVTVQLQFNWTGDTWTGTTKGPTVQLRPRETRMLLIEDLPESQRPPALAHWASVYVSSADSFPDDLLAIAASYDASFKYGAQTPFSDQLSSIWKGGEWRYDTLHDSIMTIGNATIAPTRARFTLFYDHAKSRYEVEKALAPDEQMWIDVGALIRNRIPDKYGNILPATITSGSYEFRELSTPARASLFEGKVIYDKTNGHASYGCAACCSARSVYLNYNPLYLGTHDSFTNGISELDDCGDGPTDISPYFYNWTTAASSIAYTTQQGNHTGVSLGSTISSTSGKVMHTNGRNGCYYVNSTPQGPTNVVAHPTNFRVYQSFVDSSQLKWIYYWDSSTGTDSDLAQCTVREYVTYPSSGAWNWPSPPYSTAGNPTNNPTTGSSPATNAAIGDTQDNPGFTRPYAANTFTATQVFQYSCSNYRAGAWTTFSPTYSIVRSVAQSGSAWTYTVTKDGKSASVTLP